MLKTDGAIWVIGSYHNVFRLGAAMQTSASRFRTTSMQVNLDAPISAAATDQRT